MVMGPDEYAFLVNNSAKKNEATSIALKFAAEAAAELDHSGSSTPASRRKPRFSEGPIMPESPFRVSCTACRTAFLTVQEQAALAAATDYNGTADVRHVPRTCGDGQGVRALGMRNCPSCIATDTVTRQ